MKNEIVIYQAKELAQHIEVRIEDETVWLNRQQMAQLFGRDVKTIGKHINNSLKEELQGLSTVAKFATVQNAHDRFLIIDNKEVYHFGASLKDLGKKWFAFSKMDKSSVTILNSISEML